MDMQINPREMVAEMEEMIAAELTRLGRSSDIHVFALYDPDDPDGDPIDFYCIDRVKGDKATPAIELHFEGIGVWYFANRHGDTFKVRKVLLQVTNGRFAHGQVGDFEGYWDDFPQYVAEDRWVQSLLRRNPVANDTGRSPIQAFSG